MVLMRCVALGVFASAVKVSRGQAMLAGFEHLGIAVSKRQVGSAALCFKRGCGVQRPCGGD